MNFENKLLTYTDIRDVELWESQRDPNMNLVNTIVEQQLAFQHEHGYFCFPLPLVMIKFNNHLYLVDGQHRREAMKMIYLNHHYNVNTHVIYYTCAIKKQVDQLYGMINNINTNNSMVTNGHIDNDGPKLRQIRVLLKQLYNTKIWDDKKITKPYVNTTLLDEELKKSDWFRDKTAQHIVDTIQLKNANYLKTVSEQDKKEIVKNGGFCLQYQYAKARWVRTLF